MTAALVLETNNLHGGGASAERIVAGLTRLLAQLRPQLQPLSELVVTHDSLSTAHAAQLEAAAGRAVSLVRARGDYYDAKNRGFDATRAEVVAFGDADCWPERDWLARLLAPFDSDETEVVAGRTTYRGDLLGVAATTIDFLYFPSPLGAGCTRNFYANNVAFRRDTFAAHRYQKMDGTYRGHCQLLGLRLQASGVRVRFEPRARTTHRFPDTLAELAALRWRRGQDAVELTPHLLEAYAPWLPRSSLAALGVLGARLVSSWRAVGKQEMPAVNGLACAGVIAGLSLLDAAGMLHRTLIPARGAAEALSYHHDRDRLSVDHVDNEGSCTVS